MPRVFSFDEKRALHYTRRIDDNLNSAAVKAKDLRNALDATLSGKTPEVRETRPFVVGSSGSTKK